MIELEQTADGSYTLFVPELNEHYHSVKGALTESEHIFINMGMKHHLLYTANTGNRFRNRAQCISHSVGS